MLLMISSVSALTTLSAHQVDFVDQNRKFLVQVIENSGRETLSYTYDASRLNPELPSGEEIIDGQLSGRLIKNEVAFPLVAMNRDYYTAQLLWAKNGNIDALKSECYGLSGTTWAKAVDYFWSDVVYCVKIQPVGSLARNTDAEFRFEEEFSVRNSDGRVEAVTISQNKKTDATQNLEMRWNRNALTTRFPQDPSISYYALYDDDGTWRLVSRQLVDATWTRTTTGYLSEQFDTQACYDSQTAMQSCISSFNNDVLSATRGTTLLDSRIEGEKTDGAIVLSKANSVYFYPIYLLEIDADWLGIIQPSGQPQIDEIESSCFTEGSDGIVTTRVSNIADSDASFDFQWDCDANFFISPLDLIPFDGGQTKTITHNVYAQTESVTRGTCTLTIVDNGNPIKRDSQSVAVCVEERNQCDDLGDQICVGKQPKECKNVDGIQTYVDIGKACSNECYLDSDGYAQCRDEPRLVCGDGLCATLERDINSDYYCPTDCQKPNDWILTASLIGGGLALLGAIWFFTRKPNTGGL